MKLNLVSEVFGGPMKSMHVHGEISEWQKSPGGGVQITHPSASYVEFTSQVDKLIKQLEALKQQAKNKFDEFDKR